ncbi:methylmalonyl-CoA mutase family protein [Derxia lacustris]|uniref:methylmalonyl-CoA mutase family protein n=1 Tax=Derxia lacustris TaxID=764842 RepID=UPI000A1735EF|nr:methylmalonyl-CoA mutase family protein [Derxia lacustris]
MIRAARPGRPRRRAGLDLKPVYTPADIAGLPHLHSLPGAPPFLRGPHAGMYTQRPWTIRQYAGFSDAEDSNAFFHRALAEGAQGLSVAFDLPTHRGFDADDPRAVAEVGRAGVSLSCVDDMARLFDGIALDRVSVSMTMSGAVLPVLAAFILAAERQGVAPAALSGTIQNDILKEFQARNAYVFAPGPSLRIALDVVEWLHAHAPRFNAMSISGYHFQEAGADAVTELALSFANAREYLRGLRARGHAVDGFCRRLSFFFGVGMDFHVEVAKLRAARLVWSRLVESEGGRDPAARALRMHCQTSGWSLAAQTPSNNLVRTTIEAMAAIFGGTQSLHTNAWDEALCLPTDAAARLARDTQRILQLETGLCDVADPWAGSYLIERLTADLAERAWAEMEAIEADGGVLAATLDGRIAARIRASAAATQAALDSGERVIVGSAGDEARDPAEADGPPAPRAFDAAGLARRRARDLARLRLARDPARQADTLAALATAARDGGNLLAATLAAMRAGATVGECTAALEACWPRHRPAPPPIPHDYAEARAADADWNAACASVAAWTARHGRAPRIALLKLGQDGHDRGLLALASALTAAGMEVACGPLFASPAEAARFVRERQVDLAGVSSMAGAHEALIGALLALLPAGLPLVAGGIVPAPDAARLRALGVAAVFGPGSAMHEIVPALVALCGRRADRPAATRSAG